MDSLCFFFVTIIFTEREGKRKKGDRQKEEKNKKVGAIPEITKVVLCRKMGRGKAKKLLSV